MSTQELVDRGLWLRAEIKKLGAELKTIEARLERLGLERRQSDLVDTDREGRRWLARGTRRIVPVVFTADKIVGEFRDQSPKHLEIATALVEPGMLREFFKPVNKWENLFDDGKKFRARAEELLAQSAPGFVTACIARDKDGIARSDVKVTWDDAEEVKP